MFMGEYRHSLDSKHRLIIPSRFRDELGETFVVTKGLDGCLYVYTLNQWELICEQLKQLPYTKKAVRQYKRHLMSKASECTLDNQGRFPLPKNLLEISGIEKKCVVIGADDHLEIWAEDQWEAYDLEANESFEDAAEALTELLEHGA